MRDAAIFLGAVVALALAVGPFYMRMLAHGLKPDVWWRGRRDGAFLVGVVLLIGGGICYLIGGSGPLALAWLLLILAAFNLSVAATCHLALRRLVSGGDDG